MSDTTCVYPACMGHTVPGCQGPCKKPFVGRIPRQDAQFPPPGVGYISLAEHVAAPEPVALKGASDD